MKRDHGYLAKQMEDKDNVIFDLKKDLRSVKDQLNEEKIRHRRAQVIHSRIPAPGSKVTKSASVFRRKPSSIPSRSSSRSRASQKIEKSPFAESTSTSPSQAHVTSNDEEGISASLIRARVLKILREHDPMKVDKIDIVMTKFEGRETELLEKMIARYENNDNAAADTGSIISHGDTSSSRPASRQEQALARHMARMQRIRELAGHDGKK